METKPVKISVGRKALLATLATLALLLIPGTSLLLIPAAIHALRRRKKP